MTPIGNGYRLTEHAIERMVERGIRPDEVLAALPELSTDVPFAAQRIRIEAGGLTVILCRGLHGTARIVTVYRS